MLELHTRSAKLNLREPHKIMQASSSRAAANSSGTVCPCFNIVCEDSPEASCQSSSAA